MLRFLREMSVRSCVVARNQPERGLLRASGLLLYLRAPLLSGYSVSPLFAVTLY